MTYFIPSERFSTMNELTSAVLGAAKEVFVGLGAGFSETVYHRALETELKSRGIRFRSEYPAKVSYRGAPAAAYELDLLVEGCLIVELKAVRAIGDFHKQQAKNYILALGFSDALLINFGPSRYSFHRVHRYTRC